MTRYIFLSFLFLFPLVTFSQNNEIHLLSWNIKDFGKTKNDSEINEMANLVKDVDIIAIQEVVAGYGGAQAVARLWDALNRKGSKWDYAISNPTSSPKYMTERYAFIWKTDRLKTKNRGWLLTELAETIDREPFLLNFYLEEREFTIINFHSRPYNKDPQSEIEALSKFVIDSLGKPLIIAGDFNIEEKKSVFDNLKSNGYQTAVTNQKTTLKRACKRVNYLNHPIDNIFYSKNIIKVEGGVIDFVKFCDRLERARKLSDHLPVYIKFQLKN